MMQPSTMAAIRRRLNRAVWGESTGLEWGFGNLDDGSRDGVSCEQDGRPLGREGFGGRSGRDLGGFDLEDAELSGIGTLVGGLVGFFAERPFSQAGTGLARGYELARELDEVGGDVDGWVSLFEDG